MLAPELTPIERLYCLALTLALPALTYRLIENPIRRNGWLMANAARAPVPALLLTGTGVAAAHGSLFATSTIWPRPSRNRWSRRWRKGWCRRWEGRAERRSVSKLGSSPPPKAGGPKDGRDPWLAPERWPRSGRRGGLRRALPSPSRLRRDTSPHCVGRGTFILRRCDP
ncbi:hypothetical protein MPLA_1480006 [Mesorhizobium sp. ORS 3359]|nr:hypothetical protein MPLA_1480006 [Mesorhizobium sp. ORS 3359]